MIKSTKVSQKFLQLLSICALVLGVSAQSATAMSVDPGPWNDWYGTGRSYDENDPQIKSCMQSCNDWARTCDKEKIDCAETNLNCRKGCIDAPHKMTINPIKR